MNKAPAGPSKPSQRQTSQRQVSHGQPIHSQANQIQPWLTLTDLGRRYGISAVYCGKLLTDAGLRDSAGLPNESALTQGFAFRRPEQNANRCTLWHQERCGGLLQDHGLRTLDERHLVQQWAELLFALNEGSPSISTSPAQMAEELPKHLVTAVNERLLGLGCNFQVQGLKTKAARKG
ncbi:MAG: hypothetical protein ACOYLI_04375 [Synechococcus lacustris]